MKKFLSRIKAFIDYLWVTPDIDEAQFEDSQETVRPVSEWVPVYKQHEANKDGET